jgi:hypothetical protein
MYITQPDNIPFTLFQHQKKSIFDIEQVERTNVIKLSANSSITTPIALFCDKAGYGKTVSMITVIFRDLIPFDDTEPIKKETLQICHGNLGITYTKHTQVNIPKVNITLIVVSKTIIDQWVRTINLFGIPTLEITCRKHLKELNEIVGVYSIVIIVPTLYNEFMDKLPLVQFKRFIFDEPHQHAITGMKSIRASFTWFICATPELMLNAYSRKRQSFITHIMTTIGNGGILNHISIKNSDVDIANSFKMPKTKYVNHKCFSQAYSILNGLVPDNIQQQIEAGDVGGALASMGMKSTDNLIEHIIIKKNKHLQFFENELVFLTENKNEENDAKRTKLTSRIEVLRSEIVNINERYSDMMSGECPICADSMKDVVLEPNCCNMFCAECMITWLSTHPTCPICRVHIVKGNLLTLHKPEISSVEEKKVPRISKEECILNIIDPTKKCIIVSENNNTFAIIMRLLELKNIKFVYIHGNITTINKDINTYRTSADTNILIFNSNVNSSGLNLVETTDVIFYHRMNDQITEQVIGRANRLGRRNELFVHRLDYD